MKNVLNIIKEIAKGFWRGKSKSQKRVIISVVTLAVALLNVAFPIPVISFFISGLVMGVSAGVIISSIKDIMTNRFAGKIEETDQEKSENKDKKKTKKDKKDKGEKLSKKDQEQHEVAKVKRAEFEKLLNENKKPLDSETQKAMEALFDQSSTKDSSVKVEENIEQVEQSSNKAFDDVFKSGK